MKTYAYFPGCSLEKMARSYHRSSRETARALDVELKELDDWNCCGATAYFHVDELLADTLCARNLAMSEGEGLELVAPCSGCFKNMYFTNARLKRDSELADHVNYALEADGLHYSGTAVVKHLIDVFVNDVGLAYVTDRVSNPLGGLRVAPYYGCQVVRPRKGVEDIESPGFFEELLTSITAVPVEYPPRLRCCGGSLIITNRKAALQMVHGLLKSAVDSGADVIATLCPLCQTNIECYQRQVNQEYGTDFSVPVLYFTQLLGLALGLPSSALGIGSELVPAARALRGARMDRNAQLANGSNTRGGSDGRLCPAGME